MTAAQSAASAARTAARSLTASPTAARKTNNMSDESGEEDEMGVYQSVSFAIEGDTIFQEQVTTTRVETIWTETCVHSTSDGKFGSDRIGLLIPRYEFPALVL